MSDIRLLTIPAAAERLSISTRTVKRRIADGSLPIVRLNERDYRISERALAKFVESRTSRRVLEGGAELDEQFERAVDLDGARDERA